MSAVSIAAEVEGVRGQPVSDIVSDHTLHTVSNWSAWLSSQKEASCKDDAQKARKQFADDRQTKGHGLLEPCPVVWWDQDKLIWFRWCQVCVAVTSWGVQRQVCLAYSQAWWWECSGGSVMVWGWMNAAGTGELQFIDRTMNATMCCDTLKQSIIPLPSETGPQGSIPTLSWPQTHLQEDHCLAKEAEGKGDRLTKHVSRPKPYC